MSQKVLFDYGNLFIGWYWQLTVVDPFPIFIGHWRPLVHCAITKYTTMAAMAQAVNFILNASVPSIANDPFVGSHTAIGFKEIPNLC